MDSVWGLQVFEWTSSDYWAACNAEEHKQEVNDVCVDTALAVHIDIVTHMISENSALLLPPLVSDTFSKGGTLHSSQK